MISIVVLFWYHHRFDSSHSSSVESSATVSLWPHFSLSFFSRFGFCILLWLSIPFPLLCSEVLQQVNVKGMEREKEGKCPDLESLSPFLSSSLPCNRDRCSLHCFFFFFDAEAVELIRIRQCLSRIRHQNQSDSRSLTNSDAHCHNWP